MRLVDGASRLIGLLLADEGVSSRKWLGRFCEHINANKGWINKDQQAAAAFLSDANAQLATHLKSLIGQTPDYGVTDS